MRVDLELVLKDRQYEHGTRGEGLYDALNISDLMGDSASLGIIGHWAI